MENYPQKDTSVMSATDWAITIFISGLPLIGIIMLFVWAFSDSTNVHKQNWAKGMLLIFAISIALFLLFMFVFGGMAMLNSMAN